MPRFWTCRKCGTKNFRTTQRCVGLELDDPFRRCTGRRPAPRQPKHKAALDLPYEAWVERFGERCGICGDPPKNGRRLCRDHNHRAPYEPRGLLCFLCNKNLPYWAEASWFRKAADYLDASRIGML